MHPLTTYYATYALKALGRVCEREIGRFIGRTTALAFPMEKTKVVVAQSRSQSLRTTIPASIARTLGIEEGTELGWELLARGNQFVLEVSVLGAVDAEVGETGPRRQKAER